MDGSAARDFADIHNHLVPAVDDGCRTMAESLRHLTALAKGGVTRLAVSPHLHGSVLAEPDGLDRRLDELEAGFRRLRDVCRTRPDLPSPLFGQEVLVSDAETAERVFADPRVGFEGTDYALIEFGFYIEGDPAEVVRAVRAAGRRPIIAHPERYNREGGPIGLDEFARWKAEGALLQVNAGSILERHGAGIAELTWAMLEAGLPDLFGTDHHGDSRPDAPLKVERALRGRGAGEQAAVLLSENPQRILDGRDTVAVAPWTPSAAA